MTHLTAIVLTYNESEHIQDCLATLGFADLCIVFDSFSTDDTITRARDCGVQVIQHPFEDFAAQRNAALNAVAGQTDWVLFVDADERVTQELAEEVRQALVLRGYAGWRIPRLNYLFGKLTKGAGWYPDYQTRLLKVGRAHYDPGRRVHEIVILHGEEGTLKNHLIHHNYKDVAQFKHKQRQYLAYDAQILFEQGLKPQPHNYIFQPLRHFRWRYFELDGYHEGFHGLRLSALMAWYELRKYWLLRSLWQNQ